MDRKEFKQIVRAGALSSFIIFLRGKMNEHHEMFCLFITISLISLMLFDEHHPEIDWKQKVFINFFVGGLLTFFIYLLLNFIPAN
jgi:hypothetical protein